MVRKKQNPHRAGKFQDQSYHDARTHDSEHISNDSGNTSSLTQEDFEASQDDNGEVCFVDVDTRHDLNDLLCLAEVSLLDADFEELYSLKHGQYVDHGQLLSSLRLKFRKPDNYDMKMIFSFLIPAIDIILEVFIRDNVNASSAMTEVNGSSLPESVIVSGHFDGPDEGVSALVYLISQGFATIRMPMQENAISRVHILLTKKAFLVSNGLLGTGRHPLKKSTMNLMSWLRPEVLTDEAIYGPLKFVEPVTRKESSDNFDATAFYDAIKPSKDKPMLDISFPELLPELRPYQRRAAYWMVQREKGNNNFLESEYFKIPNPLCMVVESTDQLSKMYFNPISGGISLQPEGSLKYVRGGILADEMGLGKTVELLVCILAHRQTSLAPGSVYESISAAGNQSSNCLKRPKLERVECVCGAVTENYRYTGLWVQCDVCDAWQHAECVKFRTNFKLSQDMHFEEKHSGKAKKTKRRQLSRNDTSTHSDNRSFICQTCSELIGISGCEVSSAATLVVCPTPILHQWSAEIQRHTKEGAVNVKIYEGVKDVQCESPLESMITSINDLIDADIVLTTYDVLRSDLSHDCDRFYGDRRSLRFQKRYPVAPTPLTKIRWWRICLDEAQMVESNAAAAAEMAIRLSGENLWCITGTPIQRSLEDIHGLLRFLRLEPFNDHKWWTEVIKNPYEKGNTAAMQFTHKLFKQIMWRSTKNQVQDELGLPPQEEKMTWLNFSAIEAQFYRQQHESCASSAREFISKFKEEMHKSSDFEAAYSSRLSHDNASKLLHLLLKLRQACCHPQVGSSGLRSLQQSPMTMDEILQVLIGKAKTEGEEALRKCIVAVNGLAALAIIENDFSRAASLYHEALSLADENMEDFRLDPLLRIHILHNLAELKPHLHILAATSGAQWEWLSRILNNDIALRKDCESIKEKFLLQFTTRLTTAREDFRNSSKLVEDSKDLLGHAAGYIWFFKALDLIEEKKDLVKDLLEKVRDSLAEIGIKVNSRHRFRDINGLKYHLQTGLDALEESRSVTIDCLLDIDKIIDKPRDFDLERIRNCSKCQGIDTAILCLHCEMDEKFQAYENRLFQLRMGDNKGSIVTAEEALNVQKQRSALQRFFGGLGQGTDKSSYNTMLNLNDKNGRHRQYKGSIQVSRNPSELEVMLTVISKFMRARMDKETISDAKRHMDVFEAMRKEFPQARQLSVAQAQVLRAHDECKMAVSRLRLRLPHEEASVPGTLSVEELVPTNVQLSSEKFVALAELSRLNGQLRYLKGLSLEKQRQRDEGPTDCEKANETNNMIPETSMCKKAIKHGDEKCPVCHEMLGTKLMVFPCGHLLCCNCMVSMVQMPLPTSSHSQRVMCPTCRHCTEYGNVAYADEEQIKRCDNEKHDVKLQGADLDESSCNVNGSFGTKMQAVTRRILWITHVDENAKILVYSSWNDVLDVLEHSLRLNNITFVRMKGGRKSDLAIKQFKGTPQKKVGNDVSDKPVQVLLLLFRHGANGLNLLEAHHVILIEPLINPAEEAQAINRVHRIGQQSKTFVHRFIVKDTVEESIYKLNRTKTFNPYGSFRNKKDQFVHTLKDIDSLFNHGLQDHSDNENSGQPSEAQHLDFRRLPPSVAAAMAAERRQKQAMEIEV